MAAYRIKVLGSCFVVGTEDEAILICKNLEVARRAVADAERAQPIPTLQLLAQHAARISAVAADDSSTAPADEMVLDVVHMLD
jgi:hypothetical protein